MSWADASSTVYQELSGRVLDADMSVNADTDTTLLKWIQDHVAFTNPTYGHEAGPGKGHIHEIRQYRRQMTPRQACNPPLMIQKTTMAIHQQTLAVIPAVGDDPAGSHKQHKLVDTSDGLRSSGAALYKSCDHTKAVWSESR